MSTAHDDRRSGLGSGPLAWLLAAALPVFVIALGANSIWEANEAFYVDTPRHMVESGDYVTPMWNAEPRLNKPVMSYWMVAGLYHLFGVSVAVERLGIALGAFGLIAAAFVIGRTYRSVATGVLSALIIASAPRVVMFSRRIFIDVWTTCFMAITLACLVLALRHWERRRPYLAGMYVAIGLGVLTKGPVALILPAAAVVLWAALEGRWRDLFRLWLLPGALIVAAIVAPWYIALYQVHGWGPIAGFFVGENVDRFTTSMVPGSRDFLFYVPVLFGDLLPWAPLLIVPLLSAWRGQQSGESPAQASIRRLLWCWVVVIVGAFSASQTKQDLYIFPTAPAVAVLIADTLLAWMAGARQRAVPWVLGGTLVALAVVGASAFWLLRSGYYRLEAIPYVSAILVIGCLAALASVARAPRTTVAALAATFVLFNYVFVLRVLPDLERLKPAVPLADVINARVPATAEIADYNGALPPSLVFYARRPIARIGALEDAEAFLRRPDAWVVVEEPGYAELRARIPNLCEAARHPVFEAKAKDLLAGQPPPDVLLVTNQCAD